MDNSGIVLISTSSSSNSREGINSSGGEEEVTDNNMNSSKNGRKTRNMNNINSNNTNTTRQQQSSSSFTFRKCWIIFILLSFLVGIFIVGNNFNMVLTSDSSTTSSLLHRFGPSSMTNVESKQQNNQVDIEPFWTPQNNNTSLIMTNDVYARQENDEREKAVVRAKPGNLFRRYKRFRASITNTTTTTTKSDYGGFLDEQTERETEKEDEVEELWQFQQRAQGRFKKKNRNNNYNKKTTTTRKDRNQQVLQQQLEQQQKALQKRVQHQKSDQTANVMPLPVIPSYYSIFSRAVQPLHASDALMCRESVVNFVINATDGKDECFGLKKAFDKTCGSSSSNKESDAAVAAAEATSAATAAADDDDSTRQRHRNRRQRQRRRRLVEKLEFKAKQRPWKLHWYQSVRFLYESIQFIYHGGYIPNAYDKDFFFAEEEILGEAWQSAQYMVQNNIDLLVHADLMTQWQVEQEREEEQEEARRRRSVYYWRQNQQRHRYMQEAEIQKSIKDGADAGGNDDLAFPPPPPQDLVKAEEEDEEVDSNSTIKPLPPPSINLELPTFNKDASETVMQEVLILQQGDKIIAKATNQSKAAQEAAASSKALSDTTAAVSALLNDPSSVEARTCCASILNVYHDNCSRDEEEQISDSRLFFVVVVMALCGMVKSLIRHYRILWLPEAAGCILVGVFSGYLLLLSPRHHELSFDGNWFLRIMVPPIIFEAALSIDKKSFNRHIVPIFFYAVCGTLMATLLTALVVFYASHMLSNWCTPIPFIEAMTFGALISSIDPIAVLSVLSNMGMTDKDTIYVVIFGESLLNDGIAIVLFETLVHFLDENLIIDSEAISLAAVHFSVVAFGSLLIGVASGMLSTVYFWMFHGCQTPMVEVLMFFCWALFPYYVCDGIGWSGIVAAVAVGFVMDVAIVGQKHDEVLNDISEGPDKSFATPGKRSETIRDRRRIFDSPNGHLSDEARTHIHFVAEIVATAMETAIFAYLGLFLFSHRYHWNVWHTIIAILACCLSRAIMIPTLSCLANRVTRIRQRSGSVCTTHQQHAQRKLNASMNGHNYPPAPPGIVIDPKMQVVLWFSGLRGAMSFALVEHIPLYDSVSGEGTPLKPELKAMTSATILFTVFVLGGYTYYVMERLGLAPSKLSTSETEITSLLSKSGSSHDEGFADNNAHHHITITKSSPAPTATSSIGANTMTTTTSPTKRVGVTAQPGNRRRQRANVVENGN